MFLNNATNSPLSSDSENTLIAIAQEMGLVATPEMAEILSENFNLLTEAQANVVKLNKATKLKSFTTQNAIMLAREKNDPLYTQFAKASKLKRDLREKIMQKYGTAAGTNARKLLANAGKKNMVDVSSSKTLGNVDNGKA